MGRGLVCLFIVACAPSSRETRSKITYEWQQHVVLKLDVAGQVLACSNRCSDFLCLAACPTALARPGVCASSESSGDLECRTFYEHSTFEREGSCAKPDAPNMKRTSCADNEAERKKSETAGAVFGAIIIIPLTLLLLAVSAGQRT